MKYLHKLGVLLSVAFLLAAAVVILLNKPVSGYELSLYAAYPAFFFPLLILAYVISTLSVLYSVFASRVSKLTYVSVFVIMAVNFILLLQPYFRGYALYQREDAMTHIGFVRDILITGHIGRNNFYPFIHLESAGMQLLSGLDLMFLRELIPFLFFSLYIFFIYLLVSSLIKDKKYGLLAFLFASVPFMSDCLNNFTSSGTLFFLIPLILYIPYRYVSKFSYATCILALITIVAAPFMHPEFAFLLALAILVIAVMLHFFKEKTQARMPREFLTAIVGIVFILFFTWIMNFRQFTMYLQLVAGLIYLFLGLAPQAGMSSAAGASPITTYSSLLSKSHLVVTDFLRIFVTLYGPMVIYALLGLAFLIGLAYYFYKVKKHDPYILSFMSLFVILSFLTTILIGIPVILTYNRIFKYVLMLSVILIGTGLFYFSNRPKAPKRLLAGFIATVLAISMIISIFSLYPSPLVYNYNYQVTYMELDGAGWFLDKGNTNILPIYMFYTFGRFANEIQGCEQSQYKNYKYSVVSVNSLPPEHFNYHLKPYLGDTYRDARYLFLNKLTRQFYLDIWPTINRYNVGDFYRIDHDASVASIYNNGELNIYYIKS